MIRNVCIYHASHLFSRVRRDGMGPVQPCSVTCGKGLRMRQRFYINQMKAEMTRCDRQLEEKEMCVAAVELCG